VTALLVGLAYRGRGLRRPAGAVIIGAYGIFLLVVFGTAGHGSAVVPASTQVPPLLMVLVAVVVGLWPAPGTRIFAGGGTSRSGEYRDGSAPTGMRTHRGSRPAEARGDSQSRESDDA
jgi:peptidoglycan/LPS O-acetylase OafA/YrhL